LPSVIFNRQIGFCNIFVNIIFPSIENWWNELEKWSPSLKVVQYYGSQDERKEMRMGWRNGELDDVDVLLTTYNLICSTPEERRLFRVMPINYVIFDEAHMLKNMSTVRYENLVRINVRIYHTYIYA
jgi:SWI/SNF-related matrix-associated actin-dependent regulator 1 of chromatin subfamily A